MVDARTSGHLRYFRSRGPQFQFSTSYWAIQGCNTQYPIVQRSGHLLGQNGTSPLSVMPYASTNPNNLLIAELRGTGTMEDIAVDHILFPFLKPSDGYYGAQYGAAVGTMFLDSALPRKPQLGVDLERWRDRALFRLRDTHQGIRHRLTI